jgi:hypothetical protein
MRKYTWKIHQSRQIHVHKTRFKAMKRTEIIQIMLSYHKRLKWEINKTKVIWNPTHVNIKQSASQYNKEKLSRGVSNFLKNNEN